MEMLCSIAHPLTDHINCMTSNAWQLQMQYLNGGVCEYVLYGSPSTNELSRVGWRESICSSVALVIVLLVNICACSEDGSLNCGYSSIRGRRLGMEDFYDIKSSTIDDKQINFFGVFDGQAFTSGTPYLLFLMDLTPFIISGHGGTRAAEYLKEHLFENLIKHPAFVTDTKSAISMMISHRFLLKN